MTAEQAADLKDFLMELDLLRRLHAELFHNERIRRPFEELRQAVRVKLENGLGVR